MSELAKFMFEAIHVHLGRFSFETSWLELIGVVLNFLCVVLTIRRSIWCWPVGILGILLFFVMFARARLFADLITMVVMLVLSIYGWRAWIRGGPDDGPLEVSVASTRNRVLGFAFIAIGTPALGFAFHRWTPAALPYWDSLITVMSLVAQLALSRKLLENWVLWVAVDALAVPVYASRQLWFTAALYVLFFFMAASGYRTWHRAWVKAGRPKSP